MRRFAGLQGLSLTTRLSVLFVCASTLVLLLLGHLILAAIDRHFVEQDMDLLVGKLNLTQHALAVTRSREDLASLSQRLDDSLVGHQHLAIAILDPAQRMVFVSEGMHFPASILAAAEGKPDSQWSQPLQSNV